MQNELRIIGGLWRGRKIQFPDVVGLRPTPNRIRETLFNWLAPIIQEAACLDLFAGSGSLCFEALSRGAKHVLCIEKNKTAFEALLKNKAHLNAEGLDVLNTDAFEWLTRNTDNTTLHYDVVIVDPPYQLKGLSKAFSLLDQQSWLRPETLIYFESDIPIEALTLPATWTVLKNKKAGHVYYYLTQKTT